MRSRDATPGGGGTGGVENPGAPGVPPAPRGVEDPPTAVTVTAEIPVVPGAPTAPGYGYTSGPTRARASRSGRIPAPYALRMGVWSVAFLLLLALVGLWAVHNHPSWFTFVRNKLAVVSPTATTPSSSLPGSSGVPTTTINPRRLGLVSENAKDATYAVPSGGYAVVLTLLANSPCDLRIISPAGSSTVVFESVVTPADSPKTVTLSASATVGVAARATSIAVTAGGKTLETIASPKLLPFVYHFEPVSP